MVLNRLAESMGSLWKKRGRDEQAFLGQKFKFAV